MPPLEKSDTEGYIMTYSKNDNPIVYRRIDLTSTDPKAHDIWDHFWEEEISANEKAMYAAENGTVRSGDAVLYTRTIRGIVNLLSLDGPAMNERIIRLRKLDIDQIIRTTMTVIDDDVVITGDN